MKNSWICWLLLPLLLLSLYGCGDDSSGSSSDLKDLIADTEDNDPGDGGTTPLPPVGTLGELMDLGDLVEDHWSVGDHWYYTRVRGVTANGTVFGESNRGDINKAGFVWSPATEEMTFIGIHDGIYNDYYGQGVVVVEEPVPFGFSTAVDVNSSGVVIGGSIAATGEECEFTKCVLPKRSFLWSNNSFVDLIPIPDELRGDLFRIRSYSEAVDINNLGEVVLTLDDSTASGRHAYFWDGLSFTNDTVYRDDGTEFEITRPDYFRLSNIVGQNSEALAINEHGQAIIYSAETTLYVDIHYVLSFWDGNNEPPVPITEALNHLPGAKITIGVDINDSVYTNNDNNPDGHVVGNSGDFEVDDLWRLLRKREIVSGGVWTLEAADLLDVQGFFWDGGAMYPVDHLGGGASVAADLNNMDQVVGGALTEAGKTHAFIWTLNANKKGVITDLGTLGGENSFALAINEVGQVTGWSETGATYEEQGVTMPVVHAFLWDNGTMYDLGTHDYFYDYPFKPPYPFSEGIDINDSGMTTGNSITINAHPRGFFLDPVFP